MPNLAAKDRRSELHVSTCLDSKTSGYAVAFLIGVIKEFGFKRLIFRSDSEHLPKSEKIIKSIDQTKQRML